MIAIQEQASGNPSQDSSRGVIRSPENEMVSTAGNINSSKRPVSNTAVPPARSDGHSPNRNISPLVSKTPVEQETEDKLGGLNLKQIGKYRIGKALGEGTFGTVRLG